MNPRPEARTASPHIEVLDVTMLEPSKARIGLDWRGRDCRAEWRGAGPEPHDPLSPLPREAGGGSIPTAIFLADFRKLQQSTVGPFFGTITSAAAAALPILSRCNLRSHHRSPHAHNRLVIVSHRLRSLICRAFEPTVQRKNPHSSACRATHDQMQTRRGAAIVARTELMRGGSVAEGKRYR